MKKVSETPECSGCPMQRLFPDNTFVAPTIRPLGTRLVVGEAPGSTENSTGESFTGATGGWLRGRFDEQRREWKGGLFARAGINDNEVSRVNCIQCQPLNNKFPTDPDAREYISKSDAEAAIEQCHNRVVVPVLRSRAWSRIDILGDKALRQVCKKDGGIMRWRGSPLAVPDIDATRPLAVPTIHPAALARDQSMLPAVVSDLKKGLQLAPEFYNPHPDLAAVQAFTATTFAFDIETDMQTGQIICVGLSSEAFRAICVPFKGAYLSELKRIFQEAREVIGHNCIQFDLPRLRDADAFNAGKSFDSVWDTMLMQHLLQPDLPHSLGFLGSVFVAKPAWKHESHEDLELYCCRDVDVTYQCYQQLRPLLRSERLLQLYQNVSVPLAGICYDMHRRGISIDPSRIGKVRDRILIEMGELENALPQSLRRFSKPVRKRTLAPDGTLSQKTGKPLKYVMVEAEEEEIPWRSQDAVTQYLYGELDLPQQLHVKTAEPTVDKGALVKLARLVERRVESEANTTAIKAIKAIQRLRALSTLETSFCKEELLVTETLHPSFNVHGTSSGRLSSSDPNVQNIPESARFIYVPSTPQSRFLAVDYSSIENRLTAFFAQDTERLNRWSLDPSFNEHKWVASQFFNLAYEDVVKDNSKDAPYGIAKRIGHGSNYGMGPKKISMLFDMDFKTVRDLCAKWRVVNAKTVAWQEETAAKAKKDGVLTTPFGRKRWFYTDSSFTESLSFLPQSTAADVIFRAMTALAPELPHGSRIVLQVHDSLLVEMLGVQTDEVLDLVLRTMTAPIPELPGLSLPVEYKLGDPGESWGETESK